MEQQPDLMDVLTRLEVLAPKAAEYIHLFLLLIQDFEVPAYAQNPENILKCFPKGLDDDQNEMIYFLNEAIEKGVFREEIVSELRNLSSALRSSPVALWAFHPVFSHFLPHEDAVDFSSDSSGFSPESVRIHLPNLLYAAHEVRSFFRACGFERRGQEGSHEKWHDRNGAFMMTLPFTSGKLWLKNIVRELLQRGVLMDIIENACWKLKIHCRILKK